jgi:heterodisulfide reductase subunit C/quinone-modifying oxidoreductase subunit QmoC
MFPILLVATALSGISVHILRYAGFEMTCHFVYALHIVIATPILIVEMSFGKWSHMIYRPLALYFQAVKERAGRKAPAQEVVLDGV